MDNQDKQMLVSKIPNGTVIDKIPAGKSYQIIKILKINEDITDTVAIAIRVSSKSMGSKDIVKLRNRKLTDSELKKCWLIAPNAKIALIDNYEVIERFKLADREFSNIFEGVLTCINPTCSTNFREPITPRYILMQRDPLLVRCLYCDRVMIEKNIRDQL